VELVLLNNRSNDLENMLKNNNNTIDSDVLSEVQAISEELTILTDTPNTSLVPNDLNTTNNILDDLIR